MGIDHKTIRIRMKLAIFLFLVLLSFLRAGEGSVMEAVAGLMDSDCLNPQLGVEDCAYNCRTNVDCKYWAYLHHNACCYSWKERKHLGKVPWLGVTYGLKDGTIEGTSPKSPPPGFKNLNKCLRTVCWDLENWSGTPLTLDEAMSVISCNATVFLSNYRVWCSSGDEALLMEDCGAEAKEFISKCESFMNVGYPTKKFNFARDFNNLVYGWDNIQPSLKDCVKSCKATTGCKYWTYKHSNGWCFIKSARENVQTWEGETSGSRDDVAVMNPSTSSPIKPPPPST